MVDESLIFETKRNISSAFIDSSVRLGIAQAVLMTQDNLTECFGAMKCDGVVYRQEHNAFWVFTKTKMHFERRPDWRDVVTVRTFPVDNAGMRTHVNTAFFDASGTQIISANQEACVLSLANHRPLRLSDLPYPKEGFPPAVFGEPFERFPADFREEVRAFEQVVRSCHIDMSSHMNNIEYIKLALCVFPDDYLRSHELSDIEVHYTGESKEGQTLAVYCRDAADCGRFARKTFVHIREGGRCVFESCFCFSR